MHLPNWGVVLHDKKTSSCCKVVTRCQMCKHVSTQSPLLKKYVLPLPTSGVNFVMGAFKFHRGFMKVHISRNNIEEKVSRKYIFLFVHMSVDLLCLFDADSFSNVFCRFILRRGTPFHTLSDNLTNFVAAVKLTRTTKKKSHVQKNWTAIKPSLKSSRRKAF